MVNHYLLINPAVGFEIWRDEAHGAQTSNGWAITEGTRSHPQRLQALEGQALGVADAGEIELADEGDDSVTVAIGQRNHGVDGNPLSFHGNMSSAAASNPEAYAPPVNPALTVPPESPIQARMRIRETTHVSERRTGRSGRLSKKPRMMPGPFT
jgi:hypothetical protein